MSRGVQHFIGEQARRPLYADASEGEAEGVVISVARGDLHTIDVTIGKVTRRVLARRSGRLNTRHIHLLEGDRVAVQIDAYDPTRGRITKRLEPTGTRAPR